MIKNALRCKAFLCFTTLVLSGCVVSETKNGHLENATKVERDFAVSDFSATPVATPTTTNTNRKSDDKSANDLSPLPLEVKLPTAKELAVKGGKSAVLKVYLTGAWDKIVNPFDCSLGIEFRRETHLCIASSHIYGGARYKLNTTKQKVYVYLKRTTDLSEAALHLPWQDIDKSIPIAEIDISKALSTGLIEVKWKGFVNKKTGEIYDYGKEEHEGTHRKRIDN